MLPVLTRGGARAGEYCLKQSGFGTLSDSFYERQKSDGHSAQFKLCQYFHKSTENQVLNNHEMKFGSYFVAFFTCKQMVSLNIKTGGEKHLP